MAKFNSRFAGAGYTRNAAEVVLRYVLSISGVDLVETRVSP